MSFSYGKCLSFPARAGLRMTVLKVKQKAYDYTMYKKKYVTLSGVEAQILWQ
jgi:hypothetical protein